MQEIYSIRVSQEKPQQKESNYIHSVDDFLCKLNRLDDEELCTYMLQHESVCVNAILHHTRIFSDATIKFNGEIEKSWSNRFVSESIISYFTRGWVAFRFCIDENEHIVSESPCIIPTILPLSILQYDICKNLSKYSIQVPNVFYVDNSNENSRIYVYRFSTCMPGCVITSLIPTYRRLLHVRQYNIIQQNQALNTNMYLSRKTNLDLEKTMTNEKYNSGPLWTNASSSHRATTAISSKTKISTDKNEVVEAVEEYHENKTIDNSYENFIFLPPDTTFDKLTSVSTLNVDIGVYNKLFEEQVLSIFQVSQTVYNETQNKRKRDDEREISSNVSDRVTNKRISDSFRFEFIRMLELVHALQNDENSDKRIKKFNEEQDTNDIKSNSEPAFQKKDKYDKSIVHKSIPIQLLNYTSFQKCTITIKDREEYEFLRELYNIGMISHCDFSEVFKNYTGYELQKPSDNIQSEEQKIRSNNIKK